MHLLKSRVPKLWLTARRNRQEIITAGLSRRELFKMGLLTSSGYLAAKREKLGHTLELRLHHQGVRLEPGEEEDA